MPRPGDAEYEAANDYEDFEDEDDDGYYDEGDEDDGDSEAFDDTTPRAFHGKDPLGIKRVKRNKKVVPMEKGLAQLMYERAKKSTRTACHCGGNHQIPGDSYWHLHTGHSISYPVGARKSCRSADMVVVETELRFYDDHAETVFSTAPGDDDFVGAIPFGKVFEYSKYRDAAKLIRAAKEQSKLGAKAAFAAGWRRCPACHDNSLSKCFCTEVYGDGDYNY